MLFELRGRSLYPGKAEGRLVTYARPVSFYGELEEGFDGETVLLVESSRGSTVAPYVIYKLARRGRAPSAILVWRRAEPMIVAGCVLSAIPLVDLLGEYNRTVSLEMLAKLECRVVVEAGRPGSEAHVTLRCI